MYQTVICKVTQCPFRENSGYCLNRLTIVGKDGVCEHLKRGDWNLPVDKQFKNYTIVGNVQENAGASEMQGITGSDAE